MLSRNKTSFSAAFLIMQPDIVQYIDYNVCIVYLIQCIHLYIPSIQCMYNCKVKLALFEHLCNCWQDKIKIMMDMGFKEVKARSALKFSEIFFVYINIQIMTEQFGVIF